MTAPTDGASSISVTVRVRPFTIREAAQLTKTHDSPLFLGEGSLAGSQAPKLHQKGIRSIVKVVDDRCLVFDPPEDNPVQRFSKSVVPQQGKRVKDQTFAFDKVFDDNTSQSDVYEATTKNLLDSVLDGYNATVFAYGATGCGKTHTITGTVQQPGIIFMTMQELFEQIADVQDDKVTEISLSYLEIYNETIRDLLVPGSNKGGLMLREDANQAVSVAGLSSHNPQNVSEVMDMIVRGNEYRTMSPTEANATSSRSHAVLQINVSQKDRNADINEPHTMATLSIIDLAGSERASATKNRGERLMEGANINKSLLALGSCINALCDPRKHNHVPYRNSKLTRLLKFSLGGNCKTVMIVCVSPSSIHFDETQNTLRYANRAKNIQTKVTRNVFNVNRHVKDFLKKIDEQMTMINELKAHQKDSENIAFAKFRKQSEKRETVAREGISRIRTAYEHSSSERQERANNMKKLRQVERRIAMINAWLSALEHVCETREEDEPHRELVSMRRKAQGILTELETSRHHFHQCLSKSTWQRHLDTALQTGLKQLQDLESISNSEASTLERETELLKANAERELLSSVLDFEKNGDTGLMQMLLQAHFETAANVNQLLTMNQQDAVQAAQGMLSTMLKSCSDATFHVVRRDGSLPVTEALPPTRSGTPKRKKAAHLLGPSPMKRRIPNAPAFEAVRATSSPVMASPRRRLLGSAKRGISITPRKKSPVKRGVRWRDDTEDGKLAEYEKTPKRVESTPDNTSSSIEAPAAPLLPDFVSPEADVTAEDTTTSSPIPPPPQESLEIRSAPSSHAVGSAAPPSGSSRFQTGFLTRKPTANGSPQNRHPNLSSSSPEPSPLQEITANKASGRLSTELMAPPSTSHSLHTTTTTPDTPETSSNASPNSSDAENATPIYPSTTTATTNAADATKIKQAIKRASLSRHSNMHNANRVHRRRSPNSSPPSNTSTNSASETLPPNSNAQAGLFTATHARRMTALGSSSSSREISPKATPLGRAGSLGGPGARRIASSVERPGSRGAERFGAGGHASRGSWAGSGVMHGSGGAGGAGGGGGGGGLGQSRGSLVGAGKSVWR
ncbi:MAG: kinesin-like protein Klp5 [Chrysothrix sp. TS-e1954]|nr:MAG: kinesin-like protein Klp5 [Chrysothrix sp. TS-e1954]